jgi:hypothetical protein
MGEVKEVVASAARTTTGNSGALSLTDQTAEQIALLSNVTAASGTPSMVLTVEWSHDGTNFAIAEPADTHGAAITGTGLRVKRYDVKGTFYRVVWTISGGTPSLTFTVTQYTTH